MIDSNPTPPPAPREYLVSARSTDTFGRVLASARSHHFIVDGPVQNGCPGEALTPPEIFLGGIATCAVELIHVIARDESFPLERVRAQVRGTIDRTNQPRTDVTVFNSITVDLVLTGTDDAKAAMMVEGFKRR